MSFDRAEIAQRLYRDRGAAELDHRQSANAKFAQIDLVAEIVKRAAPVIGSRILDVGCGNGEFVAAFANAVGPGGVAVGIDFAAPAVALCLAKQLRACVADACALPFAHETFDAITCNYAAYYFGDIAAAIRAWRDTLVPNGVAVVSGPAAGNNSELYRFHHAVTGQEPSDADLMATGYVATVIGPLAPACGFSVLACDDLENPVRFPNAEDFVRYWSSTSLFARTVPQADRDAAIAAGRAVLSDPQSVTTITKRVTILTLRRP
jgi:ubiquinone/menaquinone biosynthesis C-methylase UbiE